MRVEVLRKTLDATALGEYKKHLEELERRSVEIASRKSSRSLLQMLADFEGTKQ